MKVGVWKSWMNMKVFLLIRSFVDSGRSEKHIEVGDFF